MSLRITIDIFSGRVNPVIILKGEAAEGALHKLQPIERLKRSEIRFPEWSTLGYRGMIVEQRGRVVAGLPKTFRFANGDLLSARFAGRVRDAGFERFVLETKELSNLKLGGGFVSFAEREMGRFRKICEQPKVKRPHWPLKRFCRCAPLYEPAWWNDGWGGQKQPHNNCYNYSTNYRTDTFGQPGRAAGAMYGSLTCAAVRPAAVADALIDSPKADNKCPKEGHLVALVVGPGQDYHWYRKGRNGYWSHKPGGTPVTNLDNSGKLIPDPRTADRSFYTDFCTFMVVMHGHIKIN